ARPWPIAAALVALAWLGVKYVPLGAVVAAVWAWRFRRERAALATAGVVGGLAAVHFGWWHLQTFGGLTPYGTNVVWAGEGTVGILESHVDVTGRGYRLYGLFLDARFGLLRWLPAAALALWGVTRRTAVHTAVVAGCVLMGTFVSITMMGWWFPGRMLVAGLPALAVLMALGATRLPKTFLAMGACSLLIGAVLAYQARTGTVYLAVNPFDMGFPLPPSWLFPDFRHFTWREMLLSTIWIAALAALRWAIRQPRGEAGGRSSAVGYGGVGHRRRASPGLPPPVRTD
ncbi:MAG TPA: hypothetical protein VHE80_04090, partial [Acidimicrobiales bacterium]|nr:hypothetical protein [Acidimicrobiales bacterium]